MKYQLYFTIIFYAISNANTQVVFNSPCPAQVAASNFNLTAYLGRWYELQRYESEFGEKGDCVIADFEQTDANDTILARQEIKLLTSLHDNGTNPETIVTNGTLKLTDSSPVPSVGHLIANFGGNDTNYLVLNTDYHNYALVWSCENLDENRSQRSVWVLSRDRQFSNETSDKLFGLMPDLHINTTFLRTTEQSEAKCEAKSRSAIVALSNVLLLVALFVHRI